MCQTLPQPRQMIVPSQEPLLLDSGLPAKSTVSTTIESLFDALSVDSSPLGSSPEERTLSDGAYISPECKSILERSLLSIPAPVYTAGVEKMATTDIVEKRQGLLGPNMALFFADEPLHIVKGQGCELFDPEGNSYLDCINNVSHVGHAHPRVAAAVSQQLFTLNTNSRYLHEGLVTLADRISATLPSPLKTVYPVVSGSEANDLAWRIACSWVEKQGLNPEGKPLHVCCVDHGYHGHTSSVIDFSAYKFWGPGGGGKAPHVHVLPCPDVYRGKNLDGRKAARDAVAAAAAAGGHIAAFFCESIISCGGQIFLPDGWLADVYTEMRSAGAVCVADEVQCGFGRVGSAFWAFQTHQQAGGDGVASTAMATTATTPDIATMGKPMGNGFPCAAVVTTPTLAAAFSNGMEFFATYGGCTASAAAALAVLDVLEEEKLFENATHVGNYCMEVIKTKLQTQFSDIIGDVRGLGLMIGIELVTSATTKPHKKHTLAAQEQGHEPQQRPQHTKEPAPATAAWVKSYCKKNHKVLLSTEGPFASVIKIKPPMCFSRLDVDRMVAAMDEAFAAVAGLSDEAAMALQKRNEEGVKQVQQRRADLGACINV